MYGSAIELKNIKNEIMKKTYKKAAKHTEYRPGAQEVIKNFELEIRIIRDVEESYYSSEGGRTRKPVPASNYV